MVGSTRRAFIRRLVVAAAAAFALVPIFACQTPFDCDEGESYCDYTCVNLDTDHDACGTCDTSCESDEHCEDGMCWPGER